MVGFCRVGKKTAVKEVKVDRRTSRFAFYGSTGHHVRSGSPANFQNLECLETRLFPSWTRDLFRCPVLSSQETHMPSPVEPYCIQLKYNVIYGCSLVLSGADDVCVYSIGSGNGNGNEKNSPRCKNAQLTCWNTSQVPKYSRLR